MFHIQRFQVSLPLPRLVKIKEAPFTGTLCKWKWCGFWMFPRYLLCDCVTKPTGTGSVFALLCFVLCALVWMVFYVHWFCVHSVFWESVFPLASQPFILGFPAFVFGAGLKKHCGRQPWRDEQTLGTPPQKKKYIYIYNVSSTKMNRAKQVFFLIL